MVVIFWIAYVLTVAEFIASPANVLRGSAMHLKRFAEVGFPLRWAQLLAGIELIGVAAVIAGLWYPLLRTIGGIVLAAAFLPLLTVALRARRPAADIFGLIFFMACALIVALYPFGTL